MASTALCKLFLFASLKLSSSWNRGASSLQVVNSFSACLCYLPQEYNKSSWPTWHKSRLLKCYMCFQLGNLLFELIIGFFSWNKDVDWNKLTIWIKTSVFSCMWVVHKHNKNPEKWYKVYEESLVFTFRSRNICSFPWPDKNLEVSSDILFMAIWNPLNSL